MSRRVLLSLLVGAAFVALAAGFLASPHSQPAHRPTFIPQSRLRDECTYVSNDWMECVVKGRVRRP